MSIGKVEVVVNLINEKVQFTGNSKSNPERKITFDYLQPLGDGQGFLGLEGLAMSFGGCVGTAIVALLRRMGKHISSFQMNITGIKREQPLSLEQICMEIILRSDNTEDSEMKRVIEQAEMISPVWLAIKNNVQVVSEFTIIQPGA